MSLAVVVPTCRPKTLPAFFDRWQGQEGVSPRWYFVHDAPRPAILDGSLTGADVQHLSWRDAEALGSAAWVIPHHTGAVRSLGLWKAWSDGAEAIACLDDDTNPAGPLHLLALAKRLDLEADTEWFPVYPTRTRGHPYSLNFHPVCLHMSLWDGCPDVDARTQMLHSSWPPPSQEVRAVPRGALFTLSAMAVVFRREWAVSLYQLLMGPDWGYHRFDDIWSGIFLKKIADHLGMAVTVGPPNVVHDRASDPDRNAELEEPGVREHDRVWRILRDMSVGGDCPRCCYAGLALGLPRLGLGPYWGKLAEAMRQWATLFPCTGARP